MEGHWDQVEQFICGNADSDHATASWYTEGLCVTAIIFRWSDASPYVRVRRRQADGWETQTYCARTRKRLDW